MADTENTDTESTDEPTTDTASTTEQTETPAAEPDTFPRSYVESLRRESAEHRTRAADRDQLAQRLQATLVARTGRLVEGADDLVPFDEAHLTDPEALGKALDDLLEARPYLAKPQRPSGDVGQGKGAAPAPFSLLDALRGQG